MANTVYSASLVMTADVNQAKAQLKSLQQSLDDIIRHTHTTNNDLGLTKGINSAITQAGNLKIALDQAMNVNTGKLNLTKFANSLKATGTDIQQIATSLSSLGVKGQQAFTQLTSSILNAEVPLKRTNKILNDFKQTFSNTIKWGISSAIFNKMVGGLEQAYGYAQDLDKSLNNIRIVTGYSSNEMAKFAKQANEAAKALKTTTTSYTDASLIYYQQGLDSKAVKERTDATIKMANVTGESAKAVSDYMTAIWNNFDNGSKSLEYYADVMTALGAATASSTDEIAAGLEKFAAVSETVGLSYEYATAALATVTAETRQSADVVGNAFKTLFSRIQGLNLGETLDDGTTLNKYSSALAKVGVDIKETNGQIKDMDVILDELGSKWQTLSNDTQMALAQTVAGVRQYNQLISLMNNWDTFKINLEVAEGAEGTLNEQQATYAESWEAATKQVRTSFEHLWDAILDENALISLTKGFAEVVDQIGNIVDAMGGMKGVLSAISFLITKNLVGNTQLFGQNIRQAAQEAENLRAKTMMAFKSMSENTNATPIQKDVYGQMYSYQEKILQKTKDLLAVNYQLTDEQKKQISFQNDRVQQLGNEVIENEQELQRQQTRNQNYMSRQVSIYANSGGEGTSAIARKYAAQDDFNALFSQFQNLGTIETQVNSLNAKLQTLGKDSSGLTEFQSSLQESISFLQSCGIQVEDLDIDIENLGPDDGRLKLENALKTIRELMRQIAQEAGQTEAAVAEKYGNNIAGQLTERGYAQGQQRGNVHNSQQDFGVGVKEGEEALYRIKAQAPSVSQSFMAIGNAISSVTMLFSSFKGLIDTWNNEDMSFGEKLLSTFTTLGMVIPMLASSFGALNVQQMSTISNLIRTKIGLDSVGISGATAGAGLTATGAGGTAAGAGLSATAAGLWSIIWPIGLVIAAIAALVAAFYGISEWIDGSNWTLEEQIESSAQAVEELTGVLDEAKNAAEELNSAFDKYDSAVNALEDCTKGTKEYYEALEQANAAALELINNNPELDYDVIDGQIKINKQSQEALIKQNEQDITVAEIAKRKEEEDLRDLKLQKEQEDYEDGSYTKEKDDFYLAVNDMYSPEYAEIEALLQETKGAGFGEKLVELQEQNGKLFGDYEGNRREDWIEYYNKAAENYLNASQEYYNTIKQNRQSDILNAKAQVTNYLGAEKVSQYTDEELGILGAQANYDIEKAIQTEFDYYGKELKQSDTQTDKLKEDWEIYKRVTGNSDYELIDNAIQGKDEDRKIVFKNAEGVEDDVSAQTFANIVGTAKALEEFGMSVSQATSLLQNLANIEVESVGTAISSMIANNDLSQMTEKDLTEMRGDIANKGFDENDVASMTSYLVDTVAGGDGIKFQEIAETAGFDTATAFVEYFIQEIDNQETALNDAIQSNIKQVSDSLEGLDLTNFNVETRENLTKGLEEAFKQGGTNALDSLTKILEVAGDKAGEVIALINSYDWDTGNAEDFANQLYEITGGSFSAKDAVEKFGAEMEAAGDRIPINELQSFIDKIHELITLLNGLTIGDIVSDEVVEKLAAQGIAIQDYAIKTYEGWKLISQIPTNDLQKTSTEALKTAQGAYNELTDNTFNNTTTYGDGTTYKQEGMSAYDLSQYYLGHENTAESANALQLMLNGMTEDQMEAALGMDIDAIDRLVQQDNNGNFLGTGTVDEYDEAFNALMSLYNQGQSGAFSDLSIDTQSLYNKGSTEGLESMSEMNEFRDSQGHITQAGTEALQGFASDDEAYSDALNDYQEAMEGVEEGSPEAVKLTEEFYNRLKKIETTKAAESLVDLTDSLKDLNGESRKQKLGEVGQVLEKVFGKKVTDEFIENNQELIEQWAQGSVEATEQLQRAMLEQEALSQEINNTELTSHITIDSTQVEDAKAYLQSMYDLAPISQELLLNVNATGQADMTQLQEAVAKANGDVGMLASNLLAVAQTQVDFTSADLESLPPIPTTIEELEPWLKALNEMIGSIELNSDYTVPADAYTPDMTSGSTGGGGGGGSGKSTGDSLQDTIDKRRERRRELLHLKQEGLNPEDASKYYQEEIDLIEEENELLEEQIGMYKEQLPEAVEDFNSLVRSKGFGEFQLVLNDDGTIANLDAVLADLQARWDYAELMEDTDLQNNLDDIYNALMGPLGLQENIDENVALIAKNRKEQAELALEDIVNRIDWRIKQIDYQIEKLNYYQEKLLIQAHGNKQTIEAMLEGFQYQEQEMLQLFEKGATLRQGIDELIAAKAQYPDYAQMFDEQILEYQSDLIDVNMDILELRAEMEELIQNVLELALDEMDIQNERIDRYVSMLDRFQNIIDLSGRSILDQSLKVELGVAKLDTLINKMSISKQTMEGLAEATKLAQEALAKRTADSDETSVSFWENQVEMLEIELEKAQDDFLTNWEEVLEAAADIFDMRVELTVQTLEQALSPFSSLSVLEDRYNKEKDLQEKYLDDATKLYELNKLNRQVNQSISDENDLLAKSKLRDIQEEILAYQKAGVQMSQYDLDILQKKYDLRLAEIALMEAQNSKTSMRLIRDAAGNWTYAYDADQTAIDEALQAVEDATYELQKASTDYIDEMTEEMISIKREFVEAIGDLDRNSTDYTEQLLYLQQHYMKEYNAVLGEFQKGVENAGLTIHDTWYGATLDLYSFEDAQKHFSNASDLAISELMVNYKDWQKVVEQAMGVAGTSWESFGDDTGATLDSLEEHIQALCDEISKLVDVLMEYVATSIGMVEEWQSKYSKQVDAELAKNEAYMEMPGHGGNAGSGSRGGIVMPGTGDYSLDMTLLVAKYGQSVLETEEFKALAAARTEKIANSEELSAQLGKQIISTENLINVLTDTTKSEQALGSDVININSAYYTQNNYESSQAGIYKPESDILYDFITGGVAQQGSGKGGSFQNYITGGYIPSPSYGNGKNKEYYSGAYDPRSGWCSKWVGDVFEYNNGNFIRGNAWDAIKSNGGTAYNGQYIANGTAVGSPAGQYGHIGIYQDGYIYGTSYTGNSLDRYTIEEWEKKYGKLYITNATNTGAGQTALDVFNQESGSTYGKNYLNYITGVDDNIRLQAGLNRDNFYSYITGYDTGGYTGTWGPYGRLALLHEKELVLNKADTSNILDAVKISRGVDDKISDMIAFTNNSLRDLLSYIKFPIFETQPIEQTVQIQAEFPGVTDQYEIQEALSNLSNDASQYLNIQRNFW